MNISDIQQRAADLFRADPAFAWAVVAESRKQVDYLNQQWRIVSESVAASFRRFGEVLTDLYENDPKFRSACLAVSPPPPPAVAAPVVGEGGPRRGG